MQRFRGWVVKLGGSLAQAPELPAWLEILAGTSEPCIVVPGGGPFKDATRVTQLHWGYPDAAAHPMAILGMAQFGLMLHGLAPRLAVATSVAALHTRIASVGSTIWLPCLDDVALMSDLPADWRVSADSIALWLMAKIGGTQLALIKANALPSVRGEHGASELAAASVVDPFFPSLQAGVGCRFEIFGRHEVGRFTSMLGHSA